jgi:hypothetical protein
LRGNSVEISIEKSRLESSSQSEPDEVDSKKPQQEHEITADFEEVKEGIYIISIDYIDDTDRDDEAV